MSTLDGLAPALDDLVSTGRIAGWVAGVADADGRRIRCGGLRAPGGYEMTGDTQIVLTSCSKPMAGALALRLVELEVLALDEPVDPWLPELAEPRVLVSPEADLTAAVPADRPITLRHLLTMTPGFGWVTEPGPLATTLADRGIAPGPCAPAMSPDEFLHRLGALPLADQPGTVWRYHTSSDVLGVLLARATGRTVGALLDEHLLQPLGLRDTTFTGDPSRMMTPLTPDEDARLAPFALPAGTYVDPPLFASLATGVVSTVGDQLTFLRSLVGGPTVLSAASLAAMRTDTLTDGPRATAADLLEPGCGWGLHVEVRPSGAIGWAGGLGTIGYADPASGRAAFLATQVTVDSPGTGQAFDHFWSFFDGPADDGTTAT